MPVRNAIWKVGAEPQPLAEGRLPSERTLEDMIVAAPASSAAPLEHWR